MSTDKQNKKIAEKKLQFFFSIFSPHEHQASQGMKQQDQTIVN